MLANLAGAFAPAFPNEDVRNARFVAEYRKLHQAARNIVSARHELVPLGADPLVDQLLSAAGFAPEDAFAMRLGAKGQMITAICAPTRIWRDPYALQLLLEVKRYAVDLDTRCILVPQGWLRAPVRADVSRTLARSRHAHFTKADLRAVLNHLNRKGISTLLDTAAALDEREDPFGPVLAMIAQGYVQIDRSAPLSRDSWTAVSR